MACAAGPATTVQGGGDAFAFSRNDSAATRSAENIALLMSAPWMAYWALAFEAMNPDNYRA